MKELEMLCFLIAKTVLVTMLVKVIWLEFVVIIERANVHEISTDNFVFYIFNDIDFVDEFSLTNYHWNFKNTQRVHFQSINHSTMLPPIYVFCSAILKLIKKC